MKKNPKDNHFVVKTNGFLDAAIKDVDMSKRIVTGVYNMYNYLDYGSDVLTMGASKRSIDTKGPNSKGVAKIKHALQHDLTQLPGRIVVLEEKEMTFRGQKMYGLYFETLMSNTQLGRDTLVNYQEKIYDNHSIGFEYEKYEFLSRDAHGNSKEGQAWQEMQDSLINPEDLEKVDMVLSVKEIRLHEGSTVSFGMNEMTPYLGSKSTGLTHKESYALMLVNKIEKVEKMLKVGTISDDSMQILEIQLLQLKQMMKELCDKLSVKKLLGVNKPVQKKDNAMADEKEKPSTFVVDNLKIEL